MIICGRDQLQFCINDDKVLMVLQIRSDGKKCWTFPSGGLELLETYEECCVREVYEETGYKVSILKELFDKNSVEEGYEVTVKIF